MRPAGTGVSNGREPLRRLPSLLLIPRPPPASRATVIATSAARKQSPPLIGREPHMTKVAVLDDWQGVARPSADWSKLEARAEVKFFPTAFADEADAARQLADFDIVLSMRERT